MNPLLELGRTRLDAVVEIGLGSKLWSVQKRIMRSASVYRAKVAVPSCNASGKTHVGGRLALAFYATYQPGMACDYCKGPCGGSAVITTSSKYEQLERVLWGQIRVAAARSRIALPGHLKPSALEFIDGPAHYLIGHSPASPEGFQGHHPPHILVLVDEASALSAELASGITGLVASGDARVVMLFNPTTEGTYASDSCASGGFEVIPIRAWDTPHFSAMSNEAIFERYGVTLESSRVLTDEPVPKGAELILPEFLDEMIARGEGPGSYEWQTRVEAQFWARGSNYLIQRSDYDLARKKAPTDGRITFGVDLAPYGDSENVCAIRRGDELVELHARSSMRLENFWRDVVGPLCVKWNPALVVFDADGPGSGTWEVAEQTVGKDRLRGFRASQRLDHNFHNLRAMWYWMLKRRFETGQVSIGFDDTTLRDQLCGVSYKVTDLGAIKVDPKTQMAARGMRRTDRCDACLVPGTLVTTARGDVPIEDVTTDDSVLTRRGFRRVLWSGMTDPDAEVVQLDVGGRSLVGTPEHPVWTEEAGFVPLSSVASCTVLLWQDARTSLSTADAATSDTPIPNAASIASTSGPRPTEATPVPSMSSSTRTITVPSPTGGTSITSTATRSTTTRPTSQRSRLNGILRSTRRQSSPRRASTAVPRSRRRRRWLATSAGKLASVARLVESIAMTNEQRARFAGRSSGATAIPDVPPLARIPVAHAPSPAGSSPVYNLTVEEVPEFFANGVLVHNCMYAFSFDAPTERPLADIRSRGRQWGAKSDSSDEAFRERQTKRRKERERKAKWRAKQGRNVYSMTTAHRR